MPLGQRAGDKSESRFCGVETEFNDDMPHVLAFNLSHGSFDFVLAPLMDPAYRPSLMQKDSGVSGVLPFSGSDLVLSPSQWSSHVVGKVSSWIDLDSEDEILRCDSETTLKQEIAWASHLSLQACLLPAPKGKSCANYARCVNQLLQGLSSTQLWLRLPLVRSDSETMDVNTDSLDDAWEIWNSFRLLCEHHSQLSVALDVLSSLPSVNSLGRWFGESVRAAIFSTDCFLTNARGYPCLSKRHQNLVHGLFNHSMQIVLSGEPVHSLPKINSHIAANDNDNNVDGVQKHPLRLYLDYVGYLYQRMDPLPEQERLEIGYRDYLQSPLQPLMDNLEAQTYETFEKDTIKYIQDDAWEIWNSFRLLCEHHSQLSVALDVLSSLPSVNSLGRWFGESVRAAIFSTDCFLTNARGYPCLSKRHQNLVHGLFNHSMQIVLSGEPVHSLPKINSHIASNDNDNNVDGVQKHPLRPYLYYVGYLYQRMDPLLEQERLEIGYRDYLQSPLQPLMDNLEAQTYETFEKDTMKYIQGPRFLLKGKT